MKNMSLNTQCCFTNSVNEIYSLQSNDNNIQRISIALVANWQANMLASEQTAFLMSQFSDEPINIQKYEDLHNIFVEKQHILPSEADYIIHIGSNTTTLPSGKHIHLPHGRIGNFSLAKNRFSNSISKQKKPYFCIENTYWRIIGLDTTPSTTDIPFWKFLYPPQPTISNEQIAWLRDVVKIGNPTDKRGIIFLSYHSHQSFFSPNQSIPLTILHKLFSATKIQKKEILWLWGCENQMAIYDAHQAIRDINIHSRCIGNGGLHPLLLEHEYPYKLNEAKAHKLLYYDQQIKSCNNNKLMGYNGYTRFYFEDNNLVINYILCREDALTKTIWDEVVLTENWTSETNISKLSYHIIEPFGGTPLSSIYKLNSIVR